MVVLNYNEVYYTRINRRKAGAWSSLFISPSFKHCGMQEGNLIFVDSQLLSFQPGAFECVRVSLTGDFIRHS
jgi:hypothetical protein